MSEGRVKTMTKYITKDQVLKIIDNVEVDTSYWAITRDGYVTPKPDTFERLHTEINNLTPADVAPVVRCKDCRYLTPQTGWGGGQCSDGERKDGGESDG